MQKFNDEDLEELKGYIYRQKKPLFIKTDKDVIVVLVLKESAKLKYINEGYLAMAINEFYDFIKEEKDFNNQKQIIQEKISQFKEYSILLQKVKDMFQGEIEKFKVDKSR